MNANEAPDGRQPSGQANRLELSPPVGCYRPHPSSPLSIIIQLILPSYGRSKSEKAEWTEAETELLPFTISLSLLFAKGKFLACELNFHLWP